ncbi:hypothetical protein F8S09_12500 [Deinococcus sp. SDU3-2]|uniref:Uncharacterized protein n=1 Tax=Deinococcus terrestris TaxID=2651870 RepID=A0A7X1TSI7_9DEIO|nr:hypothetical protein [Deinococcus terrestris]MPY67494.1 hypothetical protein [Deinococcus terrestris]
MSVLLAPVAAAESSEGFGLSYAPAEWPALLRIAEQLPAFAGLTFRDGLVPALTDVTQAERVRARLKTDPYWRKYSVDLAEAVKAQYSLADLVRAAQAVKRVRPQTTVRVDTALNRVVVNTSVTETARLARAVGVPDLVISRHERPQFRAEVTAKTLTPAGITALKTTPFGENRLNVTLTNPLNRPALLAHGCGGSLPVRVLTLRGERLPDAEQPIICTDVLLRTVFQPGESRTFPSFSLSELSRLKPGPYLWQVAETGERVPWTLLP